VRTLGWVCVAVPASATIMWTARIGDSAAVVTPYGRRAPKVVKETIKQLRAANDESGVRMWTLVGEQLSPERREPTIGRPRSLVFE
jgi:hypothetical protein